MAMVTLLSQFQGALLGTFGAKADSGGQNNVLEELYSQPRLNEGDVADSDLKEWWANLLQQYFSTPSALSLGQAIPSALLTFDLEQVTETTLAGIHGTSIATLTTADLTLFKEILHMSLSQPSPVDWIKYRNLSADLNWTALLEQVDQWFQTHPSDIPFNLFIDLTVYRLAIAGPDFHLAMSGLDGISPHQELLAMMMSSLFGARYGLAGFPSQYLIDVRPELKLFGQCLFAQWAGAEKAAKVQTWAISPRGNLRQRRQQRQAYQKVEVL
ncbi:hypothetical protein L3556_01700 [Candidatus Synechococcus calcipolaris G9]|uniref:Uncharacterized protein n=1 Tax=Candidatus Synechococcus calcipolaris G9 TaxID=1497997 RepID=A0ABT6EUZ3_9SYNE|nr:hypothetical protein [Candidatus Synechococcus calcipolaris]MDG2989653.1 hypothetical protein [Candidatus Synechococcus calcipolaris G9]